MKKWLALALALVMCLALAACKSNEEPKTDDNEIHDDNTVQTDMEYVKEKGTLVVGITEFEPMDYKDDSGEWIGFDADMARVVAEKLGVEAQSAAVVVQLVYEVAVSGGSGGRYYSNTLHRYRPFELTVHVGNPFFGKALQNLASAPEQVAHGVVGVDVVYHQRQAVHGVVRGRHASHDFYVRCQRRACGHAELSVQRAETRSPDGGPQPGHGGTALRVFLYQLHVAMAARTAQVACFGCDPYVADGGLADCGAQAPGEFMQAYGIG